jgi:hypothetical protein
LIAGQKRAHHVAYRGSDLHAEVAGMAAGVNDSAVEQTPEQRLEGFLAEFEPHIASLTRAVHARMRAQLPGAVEMVYDNYNFLVIGFGATERASEAILSIAVAAKKVALSFLWGKALPDPHLLLEGSGNQVRHMRIDDVAVLERPAVQDLIRAAVERSKTPFDTTQRNRLMVKSVSPKRRPRRPRGDG